MGTGVTQWRIVTENCLVFIEDRTVQHREFRELLDNFLLSFFVLFFFFRKEVIQPHLPIRLPCYDFTPVICLTFGSSLLSWVTDFGCSKLPWCDGRCVQGPGTYSPQHADLRLLAIPASCSRVADCNPNWDYFFELCLPSQVRFSLS